MPPPSRYKTPYVPTAADLDSLRPGGGGGYVPPAGPDRASYALLTRRATAPLMSGEFAPGAALKGFDAPAGELATRGPRMGHDDRKAVLAALGLSGRAGDAVSREAFRGGATTAADVRSWAATGQTVGQASESAGRANALKLMEEDAGKRYDAVLDTYKHGVNAVTDRRAPYLAAGYEPQGIPGALAEDLALERDKTVLGNAATRAEVLTKTDALGEARRKRELDARWASVLASGELSGKDPAAVIRAAGATGQPVGVGEVTRVAGANQGEVEITDSGGTRWTRDRNGNLHPVVTPGASPEYATDPETGVRVMRDPRTGKWDQLRVPGDEPSQSEVKALTDWILDSQSAQADPDDKVLVDRAAAGRNAFKSLFGYFPDEERSTRAKKGGPAPSTKAAGDGEPAKPASQSGTGGEKLYEMKDDGKGGKAPVPKGGWSVATLRQMRDDGVINNDQARAMLEQMRKAGLLKSAGGAK